MGVPGCRLLAISLLQGGPIHHYSKKEGKNPILGSNCCGRGFGLAGHGVEVGPFRNYNCVIMKVCKKL
jgi:hypothetical protein